MQITDDKKINYKAASVYYMVGTLVNKGVTFLTIPIFTRILSTADYGIISTYNSWLAIVGMLIGCALYMGIRLAFLDYEKQIDDVMSVVITYTALAGIVAVIGYGVFASLFHIELGIGMGVLCILHGTATMFIEDYAMYLQMKYRYKARTALLVLPNLVSVALAYILIRYVMTEHLYMGKILPTASVFVLVAMLIAVLVYRKSQVFFSKKYLGYAMKISLPLVLHGIALNILGQSDRIMISGLVGNSEVGIYSLVYNYGMAATVITTGFAGIWDPWLLKKMKDERFGEINKNTKNYVALISYAMIGVIMVGPELLKVLASEPYWEGIKIVPPIVLSNYVIFTYTFYVNVEHFYKKTQRIARNTIVAAVSNLVLNFIFIPTFGYVAAAYTTVISYVICLILHIIYAKKLIPQLFPLKSFAAPVIQVVVFVVLFYLFMDQMWIRWGLTAVYTVVLLFVHKDMIMQYFPELFARFKKS